jgi:peptide chain release factor subunit 1
MRRWLPRQSPAPESPFFRRFSEIAMKRLSMKIKDLQRTFANEIERLSRIHSAEGVLSLYVSVDPTIAYRRDHEIATAKSLLRDLEKNLEDAQRHNFERERDRTLDFLEHERTEESRGTAIFSSQAARLWKTIRLNVRVPAWASFGPRPRILPLARAADEFERYCAVYVGKEDARIFLITLGEVEESGTISDDVPGRHDEGGWSQSRYQRHHEFHVHEHLKRALGELEAQFSSRPFQRLIVTGPEEVTAEFVKLLPTPLRERLIGSVPCPPPAGRVEVLAAVAPAIEQFERSEEESLIARISELADAAGHAVLGIEATLAAVVDGRVHELAVAEGISAAGRECLNCGHLDTETNDSCPRCDASLASLDRMGDIIERAAEIVYAKGGRVEVMFGEARESLIARGGLGAVLRY